MLLLSVHNYVLTQQGEKMPHLDLNHATDIQTVGFIQHHLLL